MRVYLQQSRDCNPLCGRVFFLCPDCTPCDAIVVNQVNNLKLEEIKAQDGQTYVTMPLL